MLLFAIQMVYGMKTLNGAEQSLRRATVGTGHKMITLSFNIHEINEYKINF